MKIRLVGDHSDYHCGSAAAFRVIAAECRRSGELVADGKEFDVLVVNGEGTMHHDSSGYRKKMRSMREALEAGKRVALVNTVWQDNPSSAADVLARCDQIVVREILSQSALKAIGIESSIAIDQSFCDPIDQHAESIDFGQRPVFTDFYSKDFGFVRPTPPWLRDHHYVQMHEWGWSSLVKSLRTASVLVTGRHHGVYAACKARTPFLAIGGNTHKTEGLIKTAGVDVPLFDSLQSVREALKNETYLNYDFKALFDWMEGQRPWKLFQPQ